MFMRFIVWESYKKLSRFIGILGDFPEAYKNYRKFRRFTGSLVGFLRV